MFFVVVNGDRFVRASDNLRFKFTLKARLKVWADSGSRAIRFGCGSELGTKHEGGNH